MRIVQNFLQQWLIPGAVALVTVTAAWVRIEQIGAQHEKELDRLRTDVQRLLYVGPDGFLDPSIHSAHDLHFEHAHESVFGRRGWRQLVQDYTKYSKNNANE